MTLLGRLRANGCNLCTHGLISLDGWMPVDFAWMSYFVTMPCTCKAGQQFSRCILNPLKPKDQCVCHTCSQKEFQAEWDAVKWRYKQLR